MGLSIEHDTGLIVMEPGPSDVHGHPRALDPITQVAHDERDYQEGKAGLIHYTETALASGLVQVHAMPNEFYRLPTIDTETGKTGSTIEQFPISNQDRARTMEMLIRTQSRIRMPYHLGVDPTDILRNEGTELVIARLRHNFEEAGGGAVALKLYGDESTGGNQIPIDYFPRIALEWNNAQPHKPIIMHLEGPNVRSVLQAIAADPQGWRFPIHIAHVSSQEELEAVIEAKERKLNVTCEVTPHHLFTDDDGIEAIGNDSLVKPSIKNKRDQEFLWANLKYIDMFASDCAPHKVSEKAGDKPIWGVANHTVMLPLLMGAVEEGRGGLTLEDLYDRLVINPRTRFNVPLNDSTVAIFDLGRDFGTATEAEAEINPRYAKNIFPRLEEIGKRFHLAGKVQYAESGSSYVDRTDTGNLTRTYRTDISHLVVIG